MFAAWPGCDDAEMKISTLTLVRCWCRRCSCYSHLKSEREDIMKIYDIYWNIHDVYDISENKWRYLPWSWWCRRCSCYSHLRAMKMRRKSRREMRSSLTLTLWKLKHTNTCTDKHVYTHLQMHKEHKGREAWTWHCEHTHKHIQANTCILLFK